MGTPVLRVLRSESRWTREVYLVVSHRQHSLGSLWDLATRTLFLGQQQEWRETLHWDEQPKGILRHQWFGDSD